MQLGEEDEKGSQFIFSNFGNGDGIGSTNFNPNHGQPSHQGGAYPTVYSQGAYPPPPQQTYGYPQLGAGGHPPSHVANNPHQLHGYLHLGVGGHYDSNPGQDYGSNNHSHGKAHKVLRSLAGGAAAGAAAATIVYHLVREHHHRHDYGHTIGRHGHGHRGQHAHNRGMFEA